MTAKGREKECRQPPPFIFGDVSSEVGASPFPAHFVARPLANIVGPRMAWVWRQRRQRCLDSGAQLQDGEGKFSEVPFSPCERIGRWIGLRRKKTRVEQPRFGVQDPKHMLLSLSLLAPSFGRSAPTNSPKPRGRETFQISLLLPPPPPPSFPGRRRMRLMFPRAGRPTWRWSSLPLLNPSLPRT